MSPAPKSPVEPKNRPKHNVENYAARNASNSSAEQCWTCPRSSARASSRRTAIALTSPAAKPSRRCRAAGRQPSVFWPLASRARRGSRDPAASLDRRPCCQKHGFSEQPGFWLPYWPLLVRLGGRFASVCRISLWQIGFLCRGDGKIRCGDDFLRCGDVKNGCRDGCFARETATCSVENPTCAGETVSWAARRRNCGARG